MKRFYFIILIFLFLFFPIDIFSNIRWLTQKVDLGRIEEKDGTVEGEFRFINNGDSSLFISRVKSTCGCTEIDYTKDLIHPGDTAKIHFRFDPTGRPGKINKSISVYISGHHLEKLDFTGLVLPTEETLKKRYPINKGRVRLETDSLKLSVIKKGERKYAVFGIYNSSDEVLKPEFKSIEKGLDVSIMPLIIPPHESATVSIYIDTTKIYGEGLKESKIVGRLADNDANFINFPICYFIEP